MKRKVMRHRVKDDSFVVGNAMMEVSFKIQVGKIRYNPGHNGASFPTAMSYIPQDLTEKCGIKGKVCVAHRSEVAALKSFMKMTQNFHRRYDPETRTVTISLE